MSGSWDDIAEWWRGEVADDHSYADDVHPLLVRLLDGTGGTTIDLGCGEGQGMRLVGGEIMGTDLSTRLLAQAAAAGPVVAARLPDMSWAAADSFDRAFSVYLVDLIADHEGFFVETARIVRPGGHLAIVINHPVYTAPGSTPIFDGEETLWRWGDYFGRGSSHEAAGDRTIEFHHRSLGDLFTAAASSGWSLDRVEEQGLSRSMIERFPHYAGQERIPRLLGVRWRLDDRATGRRDVP